MSDKHEEHYDAGTKGCGEGVPGEFRAAIAAVPLGTALTVTVRDPSAKADLPALARLMGHRVLSEEPFDDGRLVITVERGR